MKKFCNLDILKISSDDSYDIVLQKIWLNF